MTLTNCFEQILKKQNEIAYSFPCSLNPPAELRGIVQVEETLGFRFNEALKELYLFANGSNTIIKPRCDNCLIPLHRFLNLSDALMYYDHYVRNDEVFTQLFEIWETNELPGKNIFPFLADDMHCYWVDLNASSKNYERIYVSGYAGSGPQYEFNSLTILFQVILECYEQNIFYVETAFEGTEYARPVLVDDIVKWGETCQKFNPNIAWSKIATESWGQLQSNK